MSVRAGGRQLTNLMNKNHKKLMRGRRREGDGSQESATPSRITNAPFRQRVFILHVCITARESMPGVTLLGTPHPATCSRKYSSLIISVKKTLPAPAPDQTWKANDIYRRFLPQMKLPSGLGVSDFFRGHVTRQIPIPVGQSCLGRQEPPPPLRGQDLGILPC